MINVITVSELSDRDLKDEYVDLKRVITLAQRHVEQPHNAPILPDYYRVGLGNNLFFTDKMFWVTKRMIAVDKEMKERGLRLTKNAKEVGIYADIIRKMPKNRVQNWRPSMADYFLNYLFLVKKAPQDYV